ncbi:RNA polymerase sigma factor [Fusicatenibacter sp.]
MIAVLPSSQPFSREISAEKPATFSRAEKALDQYGNAILRLAYSYLHNMSDAEDILQDTLLKYMQSAPVFENAQHEKAWLHVPQNFPKKPVFLFRISRVFLLSQQVQPTPGAGIFLLKSHMRAAATPHGTGKQPVQKTSPEIIQTMIRS